MFSKKLLTFIRPSEKSIFRHTFADTVNPSCSCALETESTNHFFLHCQNHVSLCTTLMNELISISSEIVSLRPTALLEVILYGDKSSMINQITNYLLQLSNISKISSHLNRHCSEYVNVIFSTK